MFDSNKKALSSDYSGWLSIDSNVKLLPGLNKDIIDVGTATSLILRLQSLGLEKVVLTAVIGEHFSHSLMTIRRSYEEVCEKLMNDKASIEVMLAGVYRVDSGFMSLVKKDELIPLPGNHILLELPLETEPPFIENIIFELEIKGFKPIISHPERYIYYQENDRKYKRLKYLGCVFQMNILSLSGYYGEKCRRTVLKLIKDDMIELISSEIQSKLEIDLLTSFLNKSTFNANLISLKLKNESFFD